MKNWKAINFKKWKEIIYNKVIYDGMNISKKNKKNENIMIEINKNIKEMKVLILRKYYNKRKKI